MELSVVSTMRYRLKYRKTGVGFVFQKSFYLKTETEAQNIPWKQIMCWMVYRFLEQKTWMKNICLLIMLDLSVKINLLNLEMENYKMAT
ncbi:Uncharacterised protein [uncultured Eubacterium sp.]|nr:Uncharacterised protein [uncultured Eubacterium sp.]